jgi:hypothetical protein
VRVVREVGGGVVRRVRVLDDSGAEVEPVVRFLSHLTDSGYSPNTVCAYAYDLRHLAEFLDEQSLGWNDFRPQRRWRSSATCGGALQASGAAGGVDGRDGPVAVGSDRGADLGGNVELLRLGDRRRAVRGG